MASTTKTATKAASLLESTRRETDAKVEIATTEHKPLVDRVLQLQVGAKQAEALLKAVEGTVKDTGRALYDKAKGADTSVIMHGSLASLKVVFKSTFSDIPFEKKDEIFAILRETVVQENPKITDDEIDEITQELFDELFEVKTSVAVNAPSDAQLVFIQMALELASSVAEDPDSISDGVKATARKLRKLQREGAQTTFQDIFVSTQSIGVKPVMAQRQYGVDPRIKALLKQTAPSINVAPKELAKVNVAKAIETTMQEVTTAAAAKTAVKTEEPQP